RADDAAGEIYGARQQGSLGRSFGVDDAQPREQKRDHHRGEDLEESFHPQMNYPPAPILDERKVRFHTPEQPGAVKQRNARRRDYVKNHQRFLVVSSPQRRNRRPRYQEEPQQKAGEQRRLPDAPQVDVLIALMP